MYDVIFIASLLYIFISLIFLTTLLSVIRKQKDPINPWYAFQAFLLCVFWPFGFILSFIMERRK